MKFVKAIHYLFHLQPYVTIDQIVQTDASQPDNDAKDDTVISCAITWISNDLENLTGKLEKLLKYHGKGWFFSLLYAYVSTMSFSYY